MSALEDKLLEVIDGILEATKAGASFAMEQIPDVVQQALTWHMIESLLFFSLGIILLIVAVKWYHFVFNKKNGVAHNFNSKGEIQNHYWNEGPMVGFVVLSFITTLTALPLVFCNLNWLMILVAPKWFLVTKFAALL